MQPFSTYSLTSVIFAASVAGFSLPSHAQDVSVPVVVELYTSQGCSSCPPADALLTKVAGNDDVIGLALHVEYWDYIGWADSFANPEYTLRQRAYARAAGERTIYTPQMVVQGTDRIVGYQPADLASSIEAQRLETAQNPIQFDVAKDDGTLTVSLAALGDLPSGMRVQLVEFNPLETVEITRGENRGKTIEYSNIVTQWSQIGEWTGQDPMEISVPLKTSGPVAVILQENLAYGPGPILAARRIN